MKQTATDTTVYVRDASGNVLSVYSKPAAAILEQTETHLYGSGRLGIASKHLVPDSSMVLSTGFGIAKKSIFTRGEKLFELSNHLGNVLVTVSDRRIQNSTGGVTVDYYTADVVTANDYFPYGMVMPGRKFGNEARYGFNGKERDKDINSLTAYDYGFRIYNSGLGRFLSVDPLTQKYPWYTPYQFAGNKPIRFVDRDGLEEANPEEFDKASRLISDFINHGGAKSAWPTISKETFAKQLQSTVWSKGYNIDQGNTWLCGVAAPAHLFALGNPTEYVQKMITLYQEGYFPATITTTPTITGQTREEDRKLQASSSLRSATFGQDGIATGGSGMRAVDYMLLGTVRNSLNGLFYGCDPNENNRDDNWNDCGTWPGGEKMITDVFNLQLHKNKYWTDEAAINYKDINFAMGSNKGVFFFVNSSFYHPPGSKKGDGTITGIYGIHYIVIKSFDITYDNSGSITRVSGTFWDYGADKSKLEKFDLSKKEFESSLKGIFITIPQ